MAYEAQFMTENPPELLPSSDISKQVEQRPSEAVVQQQATALQLFLQYHTPETISKELDLPLRVVSGWVKSRDWVQKRALLERNAEDLAGAQFRNFVRANRLGTAQRHLETATILEDTIKQAVTNECKVYTEKLGDRPVTKEQASILKTLAEALSQVTAVSARAVSLKELDSKSNDSGDSGGPGRKAPLVVLNLGKAPQEPRTIEVDESMI